jgi:hypothetical protein
MRPLLLSLVALAALAAAADARAQQASNAQAQFDYGLAEMQAGRYATGCPALAESYRIDPHPGVLFTLGECENKWGKIASALTHYEAYLDLFAHMSDEQKALQKGRDRVSSTQRERLRGQVPQLSVALPSSAAAGTTVMRDGVPVGAPSLGVPLPIDPGEHVVVAKTPDGALHEMRVTLARGERKALVVDLSAPPAPAPAPAPPPSATVTPAPAPEEPAPPSSTRRAWAWIAGGIGVAGLAVGAVAGALVLGDKSTVDAQCQADRSCTPDGLSASSHARTWGLVSDVGFGVGAAGVVTAVVLLLTSPSHPPSVQPTAAARGDGGFVGLRATW